MAFCEQRDKASDAQQAYDNHQTPNDIGAAFLFVNPPQRGENARFDEDQVDCIEDLPQEKVLRRV